LHPGIIIIVPNVTPVLQRELFNATLDHIGARDLTNSVELLDRLNPTIAELNQAIEQEVEKWPAAQRLMSYPGVGPLTALASY
jgi:transposase